MNKGLLATSEKIDTVLRFLNKVYDEKPYKLVVSNVEWERDVLQSRQEIKDGAIAVGVHIELKEIRLIVEYLTEVEKFIMVHNDHYRILYAGKVFIESGGYTKRNERETSLEVARVANIDQSRKNEERLICAGWAAAGGTAFLGLVEVWKLCFHCH